MIFTILLFIVSIPLYIFQFLGSIINFVLPTWLTSTLTNVMNGTGFLNSILPIYPHQGMAGLAGQIGMFTIFGWAVLVMGYIILLSLGFKLARIILHMFSIGQGPEIGTGGR